MAGTHREPWLDWPEQKEAQRYSTEERAGGLDYLCIKLAYMHPRVAARLATELEFCAGEEGRPEKNRGQHAAAAAELRLAIRMAKEE